MQTKAGLYDAGYDVDNSRVLVDARAVTHRAAEGRAIRSALLLNPA